MRALQYIEEYDTWAAAAQALDYCRSAVDCIGGRILPPRDGFGYRRQMFYRDEYPADFSDHLLPTGCRRVIIPPGQRRALGVTVEAE